MTEEETEYAVKAVKHVFPEHVVLQFSCTNTIAEQVLLFTQTLTMGRARVGERRQSVNKAGLHCYDQTKQTLPIDPATLQSNPQLSSALSTPSLRVCAG
jgi:hypothetical protein